MLMVMEACTKEGEQGPPGAEGPAGETGEAGTGGGTSADITGLVTESLTTYKWVLKGTTATLATYELHWSPSGETFSSADFRIDVEQARQAGEGGMVVYALSGGLDWHQLPFTSTNFREMTTIRYELIGVDVGNPAVNVFADVVKRRPTEVPVPAVGFDRLRVVILPDITTVSGPFNK